MRELILSGLGLYLLSKLTKNNTEETIVRSFAPVTKLGEVPLYINGKKVDKNSIEHFETKFCPWFWYSWKRPAVFSLIPIAPGSSKRWRELCNVWLGIRGIKRRIAEIELEIRKKSPETDPADKQMIQDLKNKQAYLFNESKRLANAQFAYEKNFNNLLKNTFTQSEINEFYQIRKQEILDRVFPQTETNLIPLDKIDLTVLNVDTGTNQSNV